jgi:hypothetical protein
MSTIKSANIPFNYKLKTGVVSQDVNLELYTEYDTDLKKTFVYRYNFFGSGKPLATIDSSGKLQPYQEDGAFTADQNLINQFTTNQNLNNALKASTRSAVKNELLKTDSSVSDVEIDRFMGTNVSANTATAPAAPAPTPPPQGSTPPPGSTANLSIDINDDPVKDTDGVRKEYPPNVVYPLGLTGFGQDYVKFTMYRYKPKGLSSSDVLEKGITSPTATNLGSGKGNVCIAVQSPAGDSNTVGWSDGSMSGIDAAMFNVAYSGISQGLTEGANKAGELLNSVVSGSYGKPLGYYFAQQAAQINGAFSRATGAILNPNLELLFQAPQLRSFNFTFKLSAREKEEADNIRKIIRFFKQGMSVKKAQSLLFLKSPDIFKIEYINGKTGKTHKSLNRFKTCALQAFNVDYAPLGSYMTYDDEAATMVAYTITMQFQEIDPIYDDDYDKLGSIDSIGY